MPVAKDRYLSHHMMIGILAVDPRNVTFGIEKRGFSGWIAHSTQSRRRCTNCSNPLIKGQLYIRYLAHLCEAIKHVWFVDEIPSKYCRCSLHWDNYSSHFTPKRFQWVAFRMARLWYCFWRCWLFSTISVCAMTVNCWRRWRNQQGASSRRPKSGFVIDSTYVADLFLPSVAYRKFWPVIVYDCSDVSSFVFRNR